MDNKTAKVLLSICIPTYNRANFLHKTISNLINQLHDNVEIVISDNGSQDATSTIVSEFKDSRINYYTNHENKGITYNLIRVLDLAKGKYVIYLSDEDNLNIDNVLLTINDFEKYNPSVIFGNLKTSEGKLAFKYNQSIHKGGYKALQDFGFKSTYISGQLLLKSSIDFDNLYYEYNLSNHGMLNVYPNNFIINSNLLDSNFGTTNLVFAEMRDQGNNYVEPLSSGLIFFKPQSRLIQFKNNVSFIGRQDLLSNREKESLIFSQFRSLINSINYYPNLYKNERIVKYYKEYFLSPYNRREDWELIVIEALDFINSLDFRKGISINNLLSIRCNLYIRFSKLSNIYYLLGFENSMFHSYISKAIKKVWK